MKGVVQKAYDAGFQKVRQYAPTRDQSLLETYVAEADFMIVDADR
jgi:hypothetical protein